MYYCAKCEKRHRGGSIIGLGHITYKSNPDECSYCVDFRKGTYLFCPNCGNLFREKRDGYSWK